MLTFSAHIFESIWVADSEDMTTFSSACTKDLLSIHSGFASEESVYTETFSLFEFSYHIPIYLKKLQDFIEKNVNVKKLFGLLFVEQTDARRNRYGRIISLDAPSLSPCKSEHELNPHIRVDERTYLSRSLGSIRRSPCSERILFRKGIELDAFDVDRIWEDIDPFRILTCCQSAISIPELWSCTDPISMTDPCVYIPIECLIGGKGEGPAMVKPEIDTSELEDLDIPNTSTPGIHPSHVADCPRRSIGVSPHYPAEKRPGTIELIDEVELSEGTRDDIGSITDILVVLITRDIEICSFIFVPKGDTIIIRIAIVVSVLQCVLTVSLVGT